LAFSLWRCAVSIMLALVFCAGCVTYRNGEMSSGEQNAHPLAGRLWDGNRQAFASEQDLRAQLLNADFVLLGEVHDNPIHHARQREWLEWIAASGKRPLIALEQFDTEQQRAIDAVWGNPSSSLDAVFATAQFDARGWDRNFYAPLIAIARRHAWPLAAANLSRTRARAVASGGFMALDAGEADRLGLERLWDDGKEAALAREIGEAHCGALPDSMLRGLVRAQRARDAVMADTLARAGPGGAVLIAGDGHVRRDYGVPLYLEAYRPAARIVAIGQIEVEAGKSSPRDYAVTVGATGPIYDYVLFTPPAKRADPCVDFPRAEGRAGGKP
jgi:uncharacterized iron-regulated protein